MVDSKARVAAALEISAWAAICSISSVLFTKVPLTSGVIFWWIRSKWVCTLNKKKNSNGLGTKEKIVASYCASLIFTLARSDSSRFFNTGAI
jgi:hypothetical protein